MFRFGKDFSARGSPSAALHQLDFLLNPFFLSSKMSRFGKELSGGREGSGGGGVGGEGSGGGGSQRCPAIHQQAFHVGNAVASLAFHVVTDFEDATTIKGMKMMMRASFCWTVKRVRKDDVTIWRCTWA